MDIYSMSDVRGELRVNTAMRSHHTPGRTAHVGSTDHTKFGPGCGATGMQNSTGYFGRCLGCFLQT